VSKRAIQFLGFNLRRLRRKEGPEGSEMEEKPPLCGLRALCARFRGADLFLRYPIARAFSPEYEEVINQIIRKS
jgi:hypothetical protein